MNKNDEITNNVEVMDSRDINDRIEYLESLENDEIDDYEEEELGKLSEFRKEMKDRFSDWDDGMTLIRDSYFNGDFAEDEAVDMGLVDRNNLNNWPLTQIDWDEAAEDLKQDYTSINFDGETYWVR